MITPRISSHCREQCVQRNISLLELCAVYTYGTKSRSIRLDINRLNGKRRYSSGKHSLARSNKCNSVYISLRRADWLEIRNMPGIRKSIKHLILVLDVDRDIVMTIYNNPRVF